MNLRHLVIVTSYPFPDEPVVRNRISAYVKVMMESGWRVTLVAGTSRIMDEAKVAACLPGCQVLPVPVRNYNRRNFVIRGWNELLHSWRLLRKAATLQADAVMVTIPSIFLLLVSLRRLAPLQLVDLRDLVWEYLPSRPGWKGFVRLLLRRCALLALGRADLISLTNPHELDYIHNHLPTKQLLIVSNGIGRDQFERLSSQVHQPGPEGILRITYIGNVGLAQNLTTLVQAVSGYEQFRVNIVGSGTDFEQVRAAVHEYNTINVQLHGPALWEQVINWYAESDVVYAQLTPEFATAMPSKLYEYLATGLPVVYGGTGIACDILKTFSGVTVVEPNDPEQLRTAFQNLLTDRSNSSLTDNIDMIRSNYIREDQVSAFARYLSKNC